MADNETKHFADLAGGYLGGFGHGAIPDLPIDQYVETPAPPSGLATWDGEGWQVPNDGLGIAD